MRIVVALLLGILALAAVAGALHGIALLACVIVAVAAAAAGAMVATEQFFWRPAAYAAVGIAIVAVLFVGTWLVIAVAGYALVIAALTWAAPLRPRRSHLDHLASYEARSA
ncbi:MAG: hypothetical protein JO257_06725 [Deltaproteobacteria bacterium]|nr:hypothetical protein [Deltaproteobacteria bacterium]